MVSSEHSPMGGSKAACFIACPGSVSLGAGLPDSESEFAEEGTLAHLIASKCLVEGVDAWELLNDKEGITKDMTDAVQVYLDDVRRWEDQSGQDWIEEGFDLPEVHKHFRGILDYAKIVDIKSGKALRLWDYKHGIGIVVEVEDNAQLKYYGTGLILKIKKDLNIDIEKVFFTVAQPRAFHPDGPIRTVVYTRQELFDWAQETLVPAMVRAETDTTTVAGDHCRFCPVRFRDCAALEKRKQELMRVIHFEDEGNIEKVGSLSNERVSLFLDTFDKAKIVAKAINTLAFQRLKAGQKIPGRKLVNGKTNRVWKDSAEKALVKEYKSQAFEVKKLKSPAVIEKLPGGETLASEHAFKPLAKLTMVEDSDSRTAINTDTKSLFTPVKEKV